MTLLTEFIFSWNWSLKICFFVCIYILFSEDNISIFSQCNYIRNMYKVLCYNVSLPVHQGRDGFIYSKILLRNYFCCILCCLTAAVVGCLWCCYSSFGCCWWWCCCRCCSIGYGPTTFLIHFRFIWYRLCCCVPWRIVEWCLYVCVCPLEIL